MTLFVYDRLIDEEHFCNFDAERRELLRAVEQGACVKLFAPRNFGKTSLIRNIVARKWEEANKENRVVVYADLFSVRTLEEISAEITKAFNVAITRKKGILAKGADFFTQLTKVRPVLSPPTDADSLGEFSIRTLQDSPVVDFEIVFENVNSLSRMGKYSFLVILDEFQEIKRVSRAEAKLREALQKLDPSISVVVMGSKHHLLKQIFETHNAPFANWGKTIELGFIPPAQYTSYANDKLRTTNCYLEDDASEFLQNTLLHIPEAMNRFCDFLSEKSPRGAIKRSQILTELDAFVDSSRSLYSSHYADFSPHERRIIRALAVLGNVVNISGKEFLSMVTGTSKSGTVAIVDKLLDKGIVYRDANALGQQEHHLADPFFKRFVEKHQLM